MWMIRQQKVDSLTLVALVGLTAATAVVAVLIPPLMPWAFLAVAGVALVAYWAVRWEITLWAWIWVLSFGMFDRPFWVLEMRGFFNLTISRLLFMAASLAFLLHFAWRRESLHIHRAVLWAMAAMLACCAFSARRPGGSPRTPRCPPRRISAF